MKRVIFLLLAAVCAISVSVTTLASSEVPKTNLDKVMIYYGSQVNDGFYIQYGDSTRESIDSQYVALFLNGSIAKTACLISENGDILIPLRLVAESLNATVEWDAANRSVTIRDSANVIELIIGKISVQVNGTDLTLDDAPLIFGDRTYISLYFVSEALNARVDVFNGEDYTQTHIVNRIPHVMISRYQENAKTLTKAEAVEQARAQLIIAYENKYGKYVPFSGSQKPSFNDGEEENLRYTITNLKVESQNDRFFVIPVVHKFGVDKYTGDIYVFYNSQIMSIRLFDPYDVNALVFPG